MLIAQQLMKTKKILLLFPLLFLLEIVFGESGRWLEFGGFRLRFFLFGLTVLSLYVYATLSWRSLRFAKIDLAVLFFLLINTVWGILVPILYGRSLGPSLADFDTVYILLLYFPLVAVLRTDEVLWKRTRAIFVGAASLLALGHILVWAVGSWNRELARGVRGIVRGAYDAPTIVVGNAPDGFYRIVLVTTILFVPAFFALSYALVRGYRPRLMAFLLFIVSCGTVVAYTRTFWFAVVFGVIIAGVGAMFKWKAEHESTASRLLLREAAPALVLVAAFVFITVADSGIERFHAAIAGSPPQQDSPSDRAAPKRGTSTPNRTAPKQDASVSDRVTSTFDPQDRSVAAKLKQLPYLIDDWRNEPVFGQGFGASAEEYQKIRPNKTPYLFELTAPSLLMKLGVVGSLLWLAPLVYVLVETVRHARSRGNKDEVRFAVAGLFGFALAVQSNPWLYNFVGMFVLLFYLLEFGVLKQGQPYLRDWPE